MEEVIKFLGDNWYFVVIALGGILVLILAISRLRLNKKKQVAKNSDNKNAENAQNVKEEKEEKEKDNNEKLKEEVEEDEPQEKQEEVVENEKEEVVAAPVKEKAKPKSKATPKKKKVENDEDGAELKKVEEENVEESTDAKESTTKKVNYRVIYDKVKKEWVVKKDGASRATKRVATKEEALKVAKQLSKTHDANISVHKKDGKFQKKTNI